MIEREYFANLVHESRRMLFQGILPGKDLTVKCFGLYCFQIKAIRWKVSAKHPCTAYYTESFRISNSWAEGTRRN